MSSELQVARLKSERRERDAAINPALTRIPQEVEGAKDTAQDAIYQAFRRETDLREPFRIPIKLLQGTKPFVPSDLTESPSIAFVNSRSGGVAGPMLAMALSRALGRAQVFDVRDHRPADVLTRLYSNLEEGAAEGDEVARHVLQRLTIIAAGGDGTVTWVLQVVKDLELDPPPKVAVIPLGTGNDLSRCFGWGKTFNKGWIKNHKTLYKLMEKVSRAKPAAIDCWSISMQGPWLNSKEAPYRVTQPTPDGPMTAPFWNYLSVGLDAYAAYGFHMIRESKPYLASNRIMNQFWYAWYSLASGWMCGAPGLKKTALKKLQVKVRPDSSWEDLAVPGDVRALVFLNIPSYGGGRNPWGTKATSSRYGPQDVSDGLIEVVGLRGGLHTAAVMGRTPGMHGRRLAQVAAARLTMRGGRAAGSDTVGEFAYSYMQLDGEAWKQRIPARASAAPDLVIEVAHEGVSQMLHSTERTAHALAALVETPKLVMDRIQASVTGTVPAAPPAPPAAGSSHARVVPLPPADSGSAPEDRAVAAAVPAPTAAAVTPGGESAAALSLVDLARQASGVTPNTAKEVREQLERQAQEAEAKLLAELTEIRKMRSEMRRAVRRGSRSTDPLGPAAPHTGTPRAMRSSLPIKGFVSFKAQASSGLGAVSTNARRLNSSVTPLYTALAPNSSHHHGAPRKSSSLKDNHPRVPMQPATHAALRRSPQHDFLLYPTPSGRPGCSNRPIRPSRLSQTSTHRCSLMSELDSRHSHSTQHAGSQGASLDTGSAPALSGNGPVECVNRGSRGQTAGSDATGGLSKRPSLLQRFSSFVSSAFKGGKKKPTPLLPRRRVLSIVNPEAALADPCL